MPVTLVPSAEWFKNYRSTLTPLNYYPDYQNGNTICGLDAQTMYAGVHNAIRITITNAARLQDDEPAFSTRSMNTIPGARSKAIAGRPPCTGSDEPPATTRTTETPAPVDEPSAITRTTETPAPVVEPAPVQTRNSQKLVCRVHRRLCFMMPESGCYLPTKDPKINVLNRAQRPPGFPAMMPESAWGMSNRLNQALQISDVDEPWAMTKSTETPVPVDELSATTRTTMSTRQLQGLLKKQKSQHKRKEKQAHKARSGVTVIAGQQKRRHTSDAESAISSVSMGS